MLPAIAAGARVVEVPVNHLPRVGAPTSTGDPGRALRLGPRMIAFILRFRLASLGRTRRAAPRVVIARAEGDGG